MPTIPEGEVPAQPGEQGQTVRVNVTGTTRTVRLTDVPPSYAYNTVRWQTMADPLNYVMSSGTVPCEPPMRSDPADELIKSLGISPDMKPLVRWFMQKINDMEYRTERAAAKADGLRQELRQEMSNFSDHAERIEKIEDKVWPMGVPDELEIASH